MSKKPPRSKQGPYSINPNPKLYGERIISPEMLEREEATLAQTWQPEGILIWGADNALPLRILEAVNESPTTLSCLGIREQFTRGAGFTDPGLMDMEIDKDGTTLWDLHCQLVGYDTLLDSFAVNFKFNGDNKITNSYVLGVESCRFVAPKEGSKTIDEIKFNPYYGTSQYKPDFTKVFSVWDPNKIQKQHAKDGTKYGGQVYYYGQVRAPYKFYSIPKYWAGSKWIYVDGQIQTFHKSNLDNGFFQSVLMNVIGNPAAMSNDSSQMKEETSTVDGTVTKRATKTNAQMFDEMMSATFSGVKKAGSVLALWSLTEAQAIKLQAFPTTSNFDVLSGTFTDSIRGITIATETPAILANLPQSVNSLGSDGNSMKAAVEIMQSRTEYRRIRFEQFYNKILLPNLEVKTKRGLEVKIKQYSPISIPVTIEDKFWEFLNDKEKAAYLEKNVPGIELFREEEVVAAPVIDPVTGEVIPPAKGNEAMKNLNLQQIQRAVKVSQQVATGKLTYDQGKQILLGYGILEADLGAWLPQQNGVAV